MAVVRCEIYCTFEARAVYLAREYAQQTNGYAIFNDSAGKWEVWPNLYYIK